MPREGPMCSACSRDFEDTNMSVCLSTSPRSTEPFILPLPGAKPVGLGPTPPPLGPETPGWPGATSSISPLHPIWLSQLPVLNVCKEREVKARATGEWAGHFPAGSRPGFEQQHHRQSPSTPGSEPMLSTEAGVGQPCTLPGEAQTTSTQCVG